MLASRFDDKELEEKQLPLRFMIVSLFQSANDGFFIIMLSRPAFKLMLCETNAFTKSIFPRVLKLLRIRCARAFYGSKTPSYVS